MPAKSIFNGSIARSANLPVFNLLRPILRFFAPQGRHVAPMGVKFGTEEGTKFGTGCNDKGVGPPKLKFLLRLDRNMEYKRPAGAYPLRDFHKIRKVCTSCQDALGVQILLD